MRYPVVPRVRCLTRVILRELSCRIPIVTGSVCLGKGSFFSSLGNVTFPRNQAVDEAQGKAVFKLFKVARLSEPKNWQVSAGTAELLCA